MLKCFGFRQSLVLCSRTIIKQSNGRPVLKVFIEHTWFNDPKLKALNFIEHLDQNDKLNGNHEVVG